LQSTYRNLGNLRTLRKVQFTDMMLIIASATTLLLLAGCSSPKPGSPQALAVEKEATEKKIDKNLKAMPEWYAKTPLDNNILFASATETSRNMQMSMEKAS
jgi:outer membrane murein-binding lipoprotein Lpp